MTEMKVLAKTQSIWPMVPKEWVPVGPREADVGDEKHGKREAAHCLLSPARL